MSLSERLKSERNKRGLSQKELAEKLEMNLRTYASYERGERDISTAVLLKICNTLNISSDILLGNNITPYTPEKMVPVPVVGRVAAGYTCLAETDIQSYELVSPEILNDGYDYVYLKVIGDSMEPLLLEGDMVLVRIQESVDSGDYAVVIVDEEDGVVKQLDFDGNKVKLISQNPYYPPRIFSGKEKKRIRIFGKVIESKRKFF